MIADTELLRRYVEERSEPAFAALVQRHLGLVYSVALRRVGGDAHLAEDVAQQVFVDLARKGRLLINRATLAGWLYAGAHVASAAIVRRERRRKTRELQAQSMHATDSNCVTDGELTRVRPLVDEAFISLKDGEREAIALRFFEQRSLAEVGLALHVTEEAARKRVDRAVDKLRVVLARRGVTSTATALSIALTAEVTAEQATLTAILAPKIAHHVLAQTLVSANALTFPAILKAFAPVSGILLIGTYFIWAQFDANQSLALEIDRLRVGAQTATAIRQDITQLARDIAAIESPRSRAAASSQIESSATSAAESVRAPLFDGAIFVSRDGTLRLNGQPVSLKEFLANLKVVEGKHPGRVPRLAIRAERGAPDGALHYVFEQVIKTGPHHLQIVSADPAHDWF